jgi:predicted PurR-regulated permease PerM
MDSTYRTISLWSKSLFIVVVILVSLYYLKTLLVPLVFATLLALALLPLCRKFESWKLGRIFSIVLVLLLVLVVAAAIALLLSVQFNAFISDFPNMQSKLENLLNDLYGNIESVFNISQEEQLGFLKDNSTEILKTGSKYLTTALGATTNVLTFIGLVPVYVFLLLFYRDKFRDTLLKLIPGDSAENAMEIFSSMKDTVQHYVLGLSLVVLVIAALNTTGLLALGIKHAIFLGILSAVLTVIPYIGVFIGGLIPVLIALITKDSIWYAVGVIGIYWFVQFLEGNFITPKIVGSQVNINAFVVIFGLLAGGQLWGIPGLILAVPVIAILKVVFSHIEPLKPVAMLLGK